MVAALREYGILENCSPTFNGVEFQTAFHWHVLDKGHRCTRRGTPSTLRSGARLNHLAELIRRHRNQHRSRWRRLGAGRQALLALAHLRNGDTYTRLAAGFKIGVATAWR